MEQIMRKPRDFDSELKALNDKANMLKERKVRQFGELVIATGADGLDPETLTGALLVIAETREAAKKEAWHNRGAAFFRGQSRKGADRSASDDQGADESKGDGAAH
jgi:DNA-binding protein H-NS